MVDTLDALSGMPQTFAAFQGWTKQITLEVTSQTVVNGFIEDATRNYTFEGTIQPLSPKKIMLKPEGQRAFEWLQIHCLASSLDSQPMIASSLTAGASENHGLQ